MTIDDVKELVKTFEESSLTELVFSRDDAKLTLRRQDRENPVYSQPIMVHPTAMPAAGVTAPTVAAGAVAGDSTGAAASASAADSAGTAETPHDVELITSPIVGTFYRSPAPDSPPFCEVGDIVEKGRALCILEAMKVMNELEAEFRMEIVGIRVNNGEMVEYGTPLLEVRRA